MEYFKYVFEKTTVSKKSNRETQSPNGSTTGKPENLSFLRLTILEVEKKEVKAADLGDELGRL